MLTEMARSMQRSMQQSSNCASVQQLCKRAVAHFVRFENGNCASLPPTMQVCKQPAPLKGGGGICIVSACTLGGSVS